MLCKGYVDVYATMMTIKNPFLNCEKWFLDEEIMDFFLRTFD